MTVKVFKSMLALGIALGVGFTGGDIPVSQAGDSVLDYAEETHLIFMREEEKLARDVYLTFADLYPEAPVFNTIATRSEQTHTDMILARLEFFGIPDPNPDTNNLPDCIGVFTGEDYADYFTEKFTYLTESGQESLEQALYAAALIEELDMYDIARCPYEIVDRDNGIEIDGCGLIYTDERSIQRVYENLISGSENHLRAFVQNLELIIGEGNYVAQYLSQEEVDAILGR